SSLLCCFVFNAPVTSRIYTLSLHDALPILDIRTCGTYVCQIIFACRVEQNCCFINKLLVKIRVIISTGFNRKQYLIRNILCFDRSEEHTSELQSRENLVCRLLLEKKKRK